MRRRRDRILPSVAGTVLLLALVAAADTARAADIGGELLEGGALDRGIDAIRQLWMWSDPFASDPLNNALNLALGVAEALAGSILVSSGLRQLDFADPAGEEGVRRIRRRTPAETVKTLLGHLLRLVGILRSCAAVFFIVGDLL